MTANIITVIRYEYLTAVKQPGFWIGTLLLPLMFIVIIGISALSSLEVERSAEEIRTGARLAIIDPAGFVDPELTGSTDITIAGASERNQLEAQVRTGDLAALIVYPSVVPDQENPIEVISVQESLFAGDIYGLLAQNLITETARQQLPDSEATQIVLGELPVTAISYDEAGNQLPTGIDYLISQLVVPGALLFVFFMVVFSNGQRLLQSVAEEKENRMLELLLAMIKPEALIYGKIIGTILTAVTQVGVWIVSGVAIVGAASQITDLGLADFDFSTIDLVILPLGLFYTITGLLIFSGIMVGVGSLGTSYRDSQSLTSFFTVLSILPLYFITALINDPNGPIAVVFSYFPLSASMILVLRTAFGGIEPAEQLLGIVAVIIYTAISFWLAVKLFKLGALMYNRRPKLSDLRQVFFGV